MIEIHYPSDGKRPHLWTDDEGWAVLRSIAAPDKAPPPQLAFLGGIDVYKRECPCRPTT